MNKTLINYLDYTWNPIQTTLKGAQGQGYHCTKVNSGCANCWAEGINNRFGNKLPYTKNQNIQFEIKQSEMSQLKELKKPSKIGVQFMSDLFHESVPDSQVLQVLSTINTHPQHTFLVLTKRAWKLKRFNAHYPPNLWLGCSASTQRDLVTVAKDLQECDARIKWLSLEPLLGPLNLLDVLRGHVKKQGNDEFYIPAIDWVVVGCESGPKRRECRFDWVRDIAVDCSRTKIPLWVKQLQITTKNIVVDDVDEFPIELQIRQMPEA